MEVSPFLVLRHLDALFLIPAASVRQVILAPFLAPVADAAPYLAGVFNLRGELVPVVDLGFFIGRRAPYSAGDSVVVCESGGRPIGIIVNEALDVRDVAPSQREEPLPPLLEGWHGHRFLSGAARLGDEIAMILDPDVFLARVEEDHDAIIEATPPAPGEGAAWPPGRPAEELNLLHRRARALSEPPAAADDAESIPVAVARLENEYLAFGLELIREFTDVHGVTPIPCCPERIAGAINLRGNVAPLVDIRAALSIPRRGGPGSKAVIAEVEGGLVGIMVNDIVTVTGLKKREINIAPAAEPGSAKYVTGAAVSGGVPLTLVDLRKLLLDGELVVNEEV